MPSVSAAFYTDSTNISLTSATSTVTISKVPTASPSGQVAAAFSPSHEWHYPERAALPSGLIFAGLIFAGSIFASGPC